jgi:anti-anti-sigma factor
MEVPMSFGEFTYDIRSRGGVKVVKLGGPIVVGNPKLRAVVKDLLDQGDKLFVLDLEGVTYMDSMGVGELAAACASARRQGACIKLASLPTRIRTLLEMVQILKGFETFSDQDGAVSSFGWPPKPGGSAPQGA